jgi:pimeloyl-ACP methyl ester carboxylesterase
MKRLSLSVFCMFVFFSATSLPYKSDSVYYCSLNDSIHFGATFTYPADNKRSPAVIIVSGTGMQDRDGTFSGHRPFFTIADHLSGRGFAVLRVDDRGVGETSGNYADATTKDFAADVLAGIRYLKSRPEVDTAQIGLIGHSEGGCVAFMLAAGCSGVQFIITLAGVGVDGLEILKLQNEAILRSDKRLNDALKEEYMRLYNVLFDAVKEVPVDSPVDSALYQAFDAWQAGQSEELLKAMGMAQERGRMFISRYAYQANRKWYREMLLFDPAGYIPRIKIPVISLNGDRDIMVPARENLASIERLLKEGGNTRYKMAVMEGHNHLFQHCNECTREEMPELEEDISRETLDIIYEWLSTVLR